MLGTNSLHRGLLIASMTLILVGMLHFLDAIPGRSKYTYTQVHNINRLSGKKPGESQKEPKPAEDSQVAESCADRLDYLNQLGLSQSIKYSRRCVKPVFPREVDRDSITNITASLITTTVSINSTDSCNSADAPDVSNLLETCNPIDLPVPIPDPENRGQYGHLIFGVATSYSRLRDSKTSFAHWLAHSGATLVGLITDEQPEKLDFSALQSEYHAAGIHLQLVPKHDPAHTTEESHLMLISDMLEATSEHESSVKAHATTHWFGVLDDDTFFPSLHSLATTLAKYDHTRPQYLGQLTENAAMVPIGILGAFGGAGIFLSSALAAELGPHLDSCRSDTLGGDIQIMQCVHTHSTARLTRVPGLWQADIVGDSAGFYESGRRMLSMHHWKSWNHLPVVEMAAVSRVCGECFLQRFIFGAQKREGQEEGDENQPIAVLNNGYSINVYAAGVALPDLSRTEQTWDDWDRDPWQDYQWSLGPLRSKMSKHKKKSYWLAAAVASESGGLTQVYLHRGDEGKDDEVIELEWAAP